MSCMIKIFPSTIEVNLSEYPQSTTIHGIKYLANRSRPLVERIFWIIAFILSITFLGIFLYKIGRTWMKNEFMIIERNKATYIFEIPFPAVTICPQIKIKKDKLDLSNMANDLSQSDYLNLSDSNYGKYVVMASQICDTELFEGAGALPKDWPSTKNIFSNDWIDTLNDISPSFDEVFESCQLANWDNDISDLEFPSKENCGRLFSKAITNEGVCFTFNAISDVLRDDSLQNDFHYHNITNQRNGWDPEKGYNNFLAYPFKGFVTDIVVIDGLKFVLNANMSNATPFCSPPNAGYKIALHSPSTYPQMYDNFIQVDVGKNYKIEAIPKTIKSPKDLKSFSPEVRQCYFNDERKLKFYTFYNEQNCRLECYANHSKVMLGGVPFSSPRDSNTTNIIMPYKNYHWELPEFVEFIKGHIKLFGLQGSPRFEDIFNCNCLAECNAIHYDNKILQSDDQISIKLSQAALVDQLNGNKKTTIEILFNTPSFKGKKRVRVYTFETMLSDFGGLLGLFMGGSILSLFELVYFLAIRNCFKSKVVEEQN